MPPKPLIEVEYTNWVEALGTGKGGVGKAVARGMPPLTAKLARCVRCRQRYSLADTLAGDYRIETMICSPCYQEMQRLPREQSCFGKPGYVRNPYNPQRIYGYRPRAIECRELCPDRIVCKLVVCGPEPRRKITLKEK
jgi:hypothetical protein